MNRLAASLKDEIANLIFLQLLSTVAKKKTSFADFSQNQLNFNPDGLFVFSEFYAELVEVLQNVGFPF